MKPNFVIIGAQKSASTFLQRCLQEHPDIWMPVGESAAFETPDFEAGAVQRLYAEIDERQEPVIGIKRPNYFHKSEVPERLFQALENPRLVLILRNPFERTQSAYFHYVSNGFVPCQPLNVGLTQLLNGELQHRYKRSAEIIEFSIYSASIQRYLNFFPRSALYITPYGRLKAAPLTVIHEILDFLDVSTDFLPPSLQSHPQAVVYSMARLRFLTLKNRFLYTYDADRTRLSPRAPSKLGQVICQGIDVSDRLIVSRLLRAKQKPRLSPTVWQRLAERFIPDIEAVEHLTSLNLAAWRQPAGDRAPH